jgi:ketosteroid isomerase-like protein
MILRLPKLRAPKYIGVAMSRVEIVRRVYEAGAAQDLEGLLDLADAACVITQDPSLPWGGRHVGHQGLTAFLSALFGTIDSEASTETLFEALEGV